LIQNEPHLATLNRELFDLPPMPPSEFKSVIEGPVRRAVEGGRRLAIEPALTERLIADARGADALPLLAFTLERLYVDYGSASALTLTHYESLGGVQGSIQAAIDNAFLHPTRPPAIPVSKEEQFARLRAAFIPWLARIDPATGVPIRRVASLAE